jgi:hypothetical protein
MDVKNKKNIILIYFKIKKYFKKINFIITYDPSQYITNIKKKT